MASLMMHSLLLEVGIAKKNVSLEPSRENMNTEYNVSNLAIKIEPELEDNEIENVPHEIIKNNINEEIKLVPKSSLQLADQTKLKNVVLDHSNCTDFSGYDNLSEPPPLIWLKNPKERCPTEYSFCKQENVGEIDEKEEDSKYENAPYDETSQLVRVKNDASFENWTIKNEELNLKEEDLEEGETGISSNVCQNRQDTPRHIVTPEEHHRHETQASQIGSSKQLLLQHMNPEEVKKFKCNQCEYQTLHKRYLKQHLLKHMNPEEVKKFKCNQCEYQTLHKRYLKQHLLRHINPEEAKQFKCNQCEYQTFRKDHVKRHLFSHMNPEEVDKFKCNQCEFQTLQKSNLKQHLRMHMNPEKVQKFKCCQCEYQTLHKRNLNQHLLKHKNPEEVNKFKCGQCEFQALQKSNLKQHMIRHMNPEEVKKFKCSQCEYQTLHKRCLQQHLLKHMNPGKVKKFKCSRCEYRGIRKDYLKQHMLKHMNPEEVNKFKCSQCKYETRWKGSIKQHLLRHMNKSKSFNAVNVNVEHR